MPKRLTDNEDFGRVCKVERDDAGNFLSLHEEAFLPHDSNPELSGVALDLFDGSLPERMDAGCMALSPHIKIKKSNVMVAVKAGNVRDAARRLGRSPIDLINDGDPFPEHAFISGIGLQDIELAITIGEERIHLRTIPVAAVRR